MPLADKHAESGQLQSRSDQRAARRVAVARMLEARSAVAAQARVHAIHVARDVAMKNAKASAERERIMRELHERRMACEKALDAARGRAAAEHERPRTKAVQDCATLRVPKAERHEEAGPAERDHWRSEGEEAAQAAAIARERRQAARERAAAAQSAMRHAEVEARDETRRCAFERDAERRKQRRTAASRRSAAYAAPMSSPPLSPMTDQVALLPTDDADVDSIPVASLAHHALRYQGCPHRCLGVAPNARATSVRKRYLALARRIHPDKTDEPLAAAAFAAVDAAFRAMEQTHKCST